MDLVQRLNDFRQQEKELAWEGTFEQYYEMVRSNPSVVRLSHATIYDMIMSPGTETNSVGDVSYKFFSDELFGMEAPLRQIVDYFNSSAQRLEVRKRILLLMGPVGGGKSTIVARLKKGLEAFTRRPEGAMYAIKSCPMHEEPMHLLPESLRAEFERDLGIHVEGDLCPRCRYMVEHEFDNRPEHVPIRRLIFSEKHRVGIGTFTPSDPKSQDISELVGGIDLSTIGDVGVESDPRAYRFDGELNIANRGLMEFIEMLKCDEKFLYVLLTLSQEQNIKTGRFSMIYADEVVVSHTNENEYTSFVGNRKSEALQDRIILVKVPYNLRVSEEVKIYEKLLKQSETYGKIHIAPHTMRIASTFAVLSRMEASQKSGMSLMKKLKLYDGQDVEGFNQNDLRELHDEAQREGMEGISPRYVINRLSNAMIKPGMACLTPVAALRALRDGFEQHTSISKAERERLTSLIDETRREYDEVSKTEVQKAFVYSFEESARTLLNNYLDNVEAFCNNQKVRDAVTDDEVAPDEKLMRSIEEQIGVTENAKRTFREEILIRLSTMARKGLSFDYTSHERLKEAIEKKLFLDLKDIVKITTSTKTPDAQQLQKINEVVERLVADHGYCAVCANDLLRYVGTLLNR